MFRGPLEAALGHALTHLETLDTQPVAPRADAATLRARLGRPLADGGVDAGQVIDELVQDAEGAIMGTASGRFFGWVIGGSLPAALAADWLTSAWDQNAGIYHAAPAAAVVEEVAGAWLKEILGLPVGASFALVTGCQMAHTTCLAAARHAVLAKRGWDVETGGLCGAPAIRIIATAERHGSLERALRLVGLGTGNMDFVESVTELESALERWAGAPAIVLLQAGELNTGAFDDFVSMIPVAKRYDAWVHVDGAFGLWAAASPRYRHLVEGVAAADSWATDGHKWLNVPYDCGYAFVAHPEPHRAAMCYAAGYLPLSAEMRDQIDWTPEFSRRARGFATYAALRQLGRTGVAELVERCCRAAREIVAGIGRLDGAEVLAEPLINQGLVRFPDPAGDHDGRTDAVIAAIQADGEAYFGGTDWRGMRVMRVSVSNWQTGEGDVRRTVAAVARVLAR